MIDTAITMNPDATLNQIIKTVQLAERSGFSTCYIADQGFTLDLYVVLTALACNTKRIRLGPGVTHPYTRHPVVTAVGIASLDVLSEGRAFLGIGAGGSRSLVPMDIPRSKPLQLTRETIEISRLLWQGKPVDYTGEFHSLKHATIGFPCRPDIEIHWAARGPKMLELGGELADVNLLHAIPHFELENVVSIVKQGAKKSNRITKLQYAALLVYDDISREIARARTVYRLVDSTEEVKSRLGLSEETITKIRKLVSTTGPASAAFLVNDEILSHFIVEGDAPACASKLRQLISTYSLTGVTFEVTNPGDAEGLLTFAAEIINRI